MAPCVDELPSPDAQALAHSQALVQQIRQLIELAGGYIPFSQYMERVLYTPGLGYYTGGSEKFGAAGDFITAPQVSPLFGRCIARACLPYLREHGSIVEYGAGNGRLAADILTECDAQGQLPRHYIIVEVSPELRERQAHWIRQHCSRESVERVHWHDSPPAIARAVILANEVADALPVELFRYNGQAIEQAYVGWHEASLRWQWRAADQTTARACAHLFPEQDIPIGYQSEFCPALSAWIGSISESLQEGALLLIDYGYPRREYYHAQRQQGTLRCHYRHRMHQDPFLWPGLCDITADVDFTALAEAGEAAGLRLDGYTTQAFFLMDNGLEQMLAESDPTDVHSHLSLMQQVKTLTLPGEMGERFQAMALTKGDVARMHGFALRDLSHRL